MRATATLAAITVLVGVLAISAYRPGSIHIVSLEQGREVQGSHAALVGAANAWAGAGARGGIDDVEKYRSAAILDAEQARESVEAKRDLEASGGSLKGESAMLARFAKDQKESLAKAASAVQRAKKRAEEYGWVDTDIDEGLHMLAGNREGVKRRNIFPSFARRVGHSLQLESLITIPQAFRETSTQAKTGPAHLPISTRPQTNFSPDSSVHRRMRMRLPHH